ncbi:hypothetical protein [Lysinibacillus fusiformis]|uniref:hypothetical protein n=1 Tax=Lysinibacillus fusiformis TaxID=28031 RepID=UPI0034E257A4
MQAKIEKFIVIHSRQIAQEIINEGQALIKMEPSRHRRGKLVFIFERSHLIDEILAKSSRRPQTQ